MVRGMCSVSSGLARSLASSPSKPKKAASTSVDWKHDQKLKEAAAVKEAKNAR